MLSLSALRAKLAPDLRGLASILATSALLGSPLGAAQGLELSGPFAPGIVGDIDWTRNDASQITPDSSHVVYRADQEVDEVWRLYCVPIDGGPSLALGSTPVPGGDVQEFRISADSQRVVYRADQDADEVFELYIAALDGHQPATRLNGLLAAGGDVTSFQLAASRVVYLASQDSSARKELYSVPLSGGTPVRLNGALVAGGNVGRYRISPNGKHVVYAADERTDQVQELFSVPVAGGVPIVRPTPRLVGVVRDQPRLAARRLRILRTPQRLDPRRTGRRPHLCAPEAEHLFLDSRLAARPLRRPRGHR